MNDRDREPLLAELAVVGKAFASPKRLALIELLAQCEHSVDELTRATGLGTTTVSAHLQILRAAALVRTRREGTRIVYRLAGPDVAALHATLGAVARRHSADVGAALEGFFGSDDVDVISRDEYDDLVRNGSVALLDVRPAEEYAAAHIPGAVSMPLEEIGSRVGEIPACEEIVAYCRGAYCVLAHDAVTLLGTHGRPARRLQEGLLEWSLDGRPLDHQPA